MLGKYSEINVSNCTIQRAWDPRLLLLRSEDALERVAGWQCRPSAQVAYRIGIAQAIPHHDLLRRRHQKKMTTRRIRHADESHALDTGQTMAVRVGNRWLQSRNGTGSLWGVWR